MTQNLQNELLQRKIEQSAQDAEHRNIMVSAMVERATNDRTT